jgi:CYTH domain-containing protein
VTVKKQVKCFIYNNQYFQLSTYLEPKIKFSVIETEAADKKQQIELPTWLKPKFEVTDDEKFSSFKIAKINRGIAAVNQSYNNHTSKF